MKDVADIGAEIGRVQVMIREGDPRNKERMEYRREALDWAMAHTEAEIRYDMAAQKVRMELSRYNDQWSCTRYWTFMWVLEEE